MDLPAISIPQAIIDAIPMEQVPTLVHPPLVHFAIVLPIMIVLLELVNIIVKRGATPEEPKGKGVSTLSFLLILAMVVIFAGAYISGSHDGKAAWDSLSQAGQSELKEHKLIGTYLVYGTLVMLLFKFISLTGPKSRVLFLLISIAFAGATLKQGKDGGELVYQHGANVEALKDCDDERFDLKDELESCEEAAKKPEAEAKVEEAQAKEGSEAKADEKKAATQSSDSVAKEEAAAEANPKMTEGEPAAKAAVEESESKEAFEAKKSAENLNEEAKADEAKATTEAEVETVAKEEAADAK